jgi:hypothetical protein
MQCFPKVIPYGRIVDDAYAWDFRRPLLRPRD